MKTIMPATRLALAATLAAACLLHASSLFARDAAEQLERQFPHVIQYELGASGFLDGDQITITAVRGDRKHIEPGGSYLVEGSYTLGSANSADLAFYCTTHDSSGTLSAQDIQRIKEARGLLDELIDAGKSTHEQRAKIKLLVLEALSGATPVQDGQRMKITTGTGKFYLYETNLADGWLHVSFYPDNSSWHGGVYFGEKGRENTIMRKQGFYDNKPSVKPTDKPHDSGSSLASVGNSAFLAYLGNPVPPPANLDARYTKDGLISAIQLAARNAGITVKKMAVDDSEFPFLVGVFCAGSDAAKLKAEIKKMDGYEYGGGVGDDSNSDGSDTCNVFCIIPYQACPQAAWQQIQHRRMLREEVFYEQFSRQE